MSLPGYTVLRGEVPTWVHSVKVVRFLPGYTMLKGEVPTWVHSVDG